MHWAFDSKACKETIVAEILGDREALIAEIKRRAQHRALEKEAAADKRSSAILADAGERRATILRQLEQESELQLAAMIRRSSAKGNSKLAGILRFSANNPSIGFGGMWRRGFGRWSRDRNTRTCCSAWRCSPRANWEVVNSCWLPIRWVTRCSRPMCWNSGPRGLK